METNPPLPSSEQIMKRLQSLKHKSHSRLLINQILKTNIYIEKEKIDIKFRGKQVYHFSLRIAKFRHRA